MNVGDKLISYEHHLYIIGTGTKTSFPSSRTINKIPIQAFPVMNIFAFISQFLRTSFIDLIIGGVSLELYALKSARSYKDCWQAQKLHFESKVNSRLLNENEAHRTSWFFSWTWSHFTQHQSSYKILQKQTYRLSDPFFGFSSVGLTQSVEVRLRFHGFIPTRSFNFCRSNFSVRESLGFSS